MQSPPSRQLPRPGASPVIAVGNRPTGKTSALPRLSATPLPPPLRILHLETEREVSESARRELQQSGMQADLVRVDNRSDFLTALKEFNFDVVLADHRTPGMDGSAVLNEARQKNAQLPVLFLVGSMDESASAKLLSEGAAAVLLKDKLGQLPEAVRAAMRAGKERTGRQHAAEALNESEARFRQIADNLHQGFWMAKAEGGVLLMVNPAFEEILNRPAGSLTREPVKLLDLVHAQDREAVARVLEVDGRQHDFQLEFRISRPDSAVRWLWNRGFPIRDAGGNISHLVGIVEDITERKSAAEKFKRDYERLGAMLGALPDACLLLDNSGRIVDFHGGIESDVFGAAKEIKGRTLAEVFPTGVTNKLSEALAGARTKRALVTVEFSRRDGQLDQFYEARVSPLEGDHFFAFIRNITDRRRGEEELHRSQERLAHLIDSLPGIVFTTNYVGEWAVTYLSEGLVALTGYSPAELQGNQHPSLASIMNVEDRERALIEMQVALTERRNYVVEYRVRTKAGLDKWLWEQGRGLYDQSGLLVGREGFIADITDRKGAEEALRDSEWLHHSLVEHMPMFMFRKDKDGRVTFANRRLCELLGRPLTELLGKTDEDLFPAEQAKLYREGDQRVWEHGVVLDAVEKLPCPTGETHHMHVIKVPLRDANGNVVGVQGVFTDVTQRIKAEEQLRETNDRLAATVQELKETQDRLVRQERLHALGQMASGVAHDFNNSLMTILGFADLLIARPGSLSDEKKVLAHLQTIQTAAREASGVVRRLSEFYRQRPEQEVLPPAELNLLVKQVINHTEPKWKAEAQARGAAIAIYKDLQEIPLVQGDASELRECLTNIILNSIDAMPHGGALMFATWTLDGKVHLSIADTGVGMTGEVQKQCMEPFFTTKGVHGSGLGLSVAFGIVQRHQGAIDIQSEPGKGTTVTLALPAVQGQHVPTETGPVARRITRPLKVLVVDDEPLIRDILTEYLQSDGHEVVTAGDGREGLDAFDAADFDIVLTDKAMPQMSGDHMAAAIKQKMPEMPIILITGFGDILKASGDKPANIDLILSKPVSQNVLRQGMADVVKN